MNRSPAPTPPAARPSRAAAVGRALGALLALAVTVGVLPWLLWQATSALAPGGWEALQHLFTRQDTGSVALLAICVIGWLAWGSFVVSLLVEVPAQLRGVRAPRLPGLQVSQRAAAVLVGSLLVLLPTGTALAASPAEAAPRTAASVSASAVPGDVHEVPAARQAAADAPQEAEREEGGRGTYTVRSTRPAESLWSIAEQLYGDGEKYTLIADANEGQVMVDGRVFRADAPIQPGWVLTLPSGVAQGGGGGGLHTQSAGSREEVREHTVAGGESLSSIARDETGDASNWPDLYKESRGDEQPGGLPRITDPDQIFPGQRITVPAVGTSEQDRPAHDAPTTPKAPKDQDKDRDEDRAGGGTDRQGQHDPGAGHERADDDTRAGTSGGTNDREQAAGSAAPHATPTPSQRPAPPASEQPAQETPASPSASTPAPQHTQPPAPERDSGRQAPVADDAAGQEQDSMVSARTAVGAAALLAAALTGTLAVRRLRQARRRKPGQTLPEAAPADQEALLEQTAGDGGDGVHRLAAALAALADGEATPPPLRAARITLDGVEVLPEDVQAPPQAPFTTSRAGWWHLPDTAPLPAHDPQVMPYPAMATLGTDPAGSLVLAHLPGLSVLLVDGSPEQRAEVIACLATELTIGPSADHVEVIACGLGAMGADVTAFGVQYLPDPRIAASEFASRVLEAHQEPAGSAMPYVVLCAGELDSDSAWQFAQTLDKARGLVPAVLVLPETAGSVFPDAETIDAAVETPQRVDALGCDVVLQRLDARSVAELAAAFRRTAEPPEDAEGVWEHVPPEAIALPTPAPAVQAVPDTATQQHADDDAPASEPGAAASQDGGQEDKGADGSVGEGPVAFQALLGAATATPGQAPLRSVQVGHHSPAAAEGDPSSAVQGGPGTPGWAGPKFLVPPAHAILAAERIAPVPETESDRALTEADEQDTRPRLRVLGRVEIEHVDLEPRLTELTAHLVLRPGCSADVLCEDLGDSAPWSAATLNARLRSLRNKLGTDPDGAPYVPQRKTKASPYAVTDQVRCDWTEFERLSELGLSRGKDGLHYLERALRLVDGVPLGEHPASWMVPLRTYMQNRITDVAHTVATYRMEDGPHQDFPSARKACAVGLSADPLAEVVHRSLMKVEAQAGNRSGLQAAIARWQDTTRHLDAERIDATTQRLVDQLLAAS
ncbi:LysM peptidoglycan-binding domain-containing protein (plasmid) [Streptomyces sp. SDT5-1]|uniref:LysM peptidoglycan-binding domain-containing protein n=1 Tax=Streptomyces sp. SDT5-1 TaxID=3406418 RepID=UPI003FCF708C